MIWLRYMALPVGIVAVEILAGLFIVSWRGKLFEPKH